MAKSEKPYLDNARTCQEHSDAGQWDQALVECRQAIETGTFPPEQESSLQARLCFSFLESDPSDPEAARPHCEKAVELAPESAFALNARAVGRDRLSLYSEALADYTRAIEIDPMFDAAYYNRGKLYSNQNKPDLAIVDFTKSIEIDPNFKDAYIYRGIAYHDQNKIDLAIADYTRVIEIDPKDAVAYGVRGEFYLKQSDLDHAITDYDRAIELDPDFKDAFNGRGSAYRLQGKLDLAFTDLNRAIEIDPNFEDAYNNRGNVYRDQGKLDLAIADYTRAIEIDPDLAPAFSNLALLLATAPNSDKRDSRKAVELAEKAVALKPEDPAYLDTLAAAYAEADRFAEAIRVQERAIKLLTAQGKDEAVSDFGSRLKLYQQNKPFRSLPQTGANQ